MVKYCFLAVLALVLFESIGCGKLPSSIKVCKRTDPKLNDCLKQAINDAFPKLSSGIPELNLSPLEPLMVPSVSIGEGKGSVHVVQKYKNLGIYNLIGSKVNKLNANLNESSVKISTEISAPEYRLEGDYDFNGKILLLPIVGDGKCVLKLTDITADLMFTGERYEKKGKGYLNVTDFKITLKPKRVHFKFDNLFHGDAKLGPQMNTILNDNWSDVFEDVRAGYEEFIASMGKHIANNIFSRVPYDEMFPQ